MADPRQMEDFDPSDLSQRPEGWRQWKARADWLQEQIDKFVIELKRITDSAELLSHEVSDPGTEALAAIYCARATLNQWHQEDQPKVRDRG